MHVQVTNPISWSYLIIIHVGMGLLLLPARRDVFMGKYLVRPLQCWAESAPLDQNRVKVSENLGATSVASVAPVDTSLLF